MHNSKSYLFLLFVALFPYLDSSTNANILDAKHVNVIEQAAPTSATASLLPKKAGGVHHMSKDDWTANQRGA